MAASSGKPVTIDTARLLAMLDELHQIGKRPVGGTFRGVYNAGWAEAQKKIIAWMKDAGLDVRVDAVGNVWGHLAGREAGPPIVAGSHFDTVPDGGKYDGQLGHIGALVAVDTLHKKLGQPRRSLTVLAACEEEGSRFNCNFWASRGILGQIAPDEPDKIRDFDGVLMADAMRGVGLDPTRIGEAKTDQIAAFIELHIEQGPILDRMAQKDPPGAKRLVGAVNAITGTGRLQVTLTGEQNHSGTTPMLGRKDAFLGAAEIALAIREMALGIGHPAVMTVGKVDLVPNIPNIVAGIARFSIDVRHPDTALQAQMLENARARCIAAAEARGLGCTVEDVWNQPPTPMAPELVSAVRNAIETRGYRPVDIFAGAGHDSQLIGRRFPTAMIFTVSKNGISHSPHEYTSPEDCTAGVTVLAETLRTLAY